MFKNLSLKVIIFGFIFTFFSSFGQSFFLGIFNSNIRNELSISHGQFGSIYANYTEECYYFDLLDLLRRLILTGGLILVGEHSIVQALLGILTCISWLVIVSIKFPYKAYWDNILSIIYS